MTTTKSPRTAEAPLIRDIADAARGRLGGRRGLVVLGAVALTGALILNWSWLVALGVAPLLLAVLPCAAMCALGLCMNRAAGRSCATEAPARRSAVPAASNMPTGRIPAVEALPDRRADEPPRGLDTVHATASEPQSNERSTTDA